MQRFLRLSSFMLLLIGSASSVFPQSTGINNSNPSSKAAIDIASFPGGKQGFFMPRLPGSDSTNIGASGNADKGLMFYDSTNNVVLWYDGKHWQGGNSGGSGGAWQLTGNNLPDTNSQYIGSNNYKPFSIRTNNEERIHVASNGTVGIGMIPTGNYILEIAGNIKTAGITETSDQRWKKDVKTLDNALNNITQLRGVSYKWRKDEFPDKKFDDKEQIGLIAQEVEKIYPQLVDTDANGYKSIQYSKVVALLIEAVKQQQIQIAQQQNEIGTLKADVSKMSQLESKVNALSALVEILAKQNPVVESRK